jgi:hypothetical protein
MLDLKIAEVRNIEDDPTQSGRCRIRIYNENDDEQQVKDDDLPWAVPLQPITSAATAKIGNSPSGLLVGSRVLITYLSNDVNKQYPIILGSIGRGALPSKGGVRTDSDDRTSLAEISEKDIAPDNPVIGDKGIG